MAELVPGLISVVVPIYNVEPFLRDCLDSLRAQT
jgi:CDP-glycerol glycerophosphotransferase